MITPWLNSIPYTQRVGLLIVIVGLICSGFYTIVWYPLTDEIKALHMNIQQGQQELAQKMSRASTLANVGEASSHLPKQASVSVMVGSSKTSPLHFRKDVMSIAGDHRVSLTYWEPDPVEENLDTQIHTRTMQGKLEGGYRQLAECLSTILYLPWALEITQLRLTVSRNVGNGSPILLADFRLKGIAPSSLTPVYD